MSSEEKIRCPKCHWEPNENDQWQCTCRHIWNAFRTYGRCPACGKVWKYTQCLECVRWSLHVDWYVELDDILLKIEETEKSIV